MDFSNCKIVPTPIGVHKREILGKSLAETLFGHRLTGSQSLFKRDLQGHYGCVNAIEFSSDGELIASGGDDRRLLLWNVGQTIFDDKEPHVIDTLHISNINSCCFDSDNRKVSTGGNDGQVIVHDLNTHQSTSVYGLSDAVYCLSPDPVNSTIMAAATGDGKAHVLDLRMSIDTAPFVLADLGSAMHSIMYNPAEPRLLATANSKHGVSLWDIRRPLKCVHYKTSVQNCMSVRFNSRGDQLLALRRRSSPVLYDIAKAHPIFEFDYKTYYNACTLKSCSFAGLRDEFVMSGSDDFCIYLWKIPSCISDNYIQSEPHMVLKGHRSIVNQVRYCPINQAIISSGVEKLIKMWSPYHIPGCTGQLTHSRRYGDDYEVERNAYSHEEYIHMVLQAGSFLSHDYTNGSVEEDPCMIAFFDSLIQREIEQNEQDTPMDPSADDASSDDGGRKQDVNGAGPLVVDSEDAGNTSVSSSSRLEDSSRPFFLDLDSSSDSEGEVDIILSAMYTRYMSARERSMSTGLRPSGKKISSVIAKGKQKERPLQRKSRPRKVNKIRKSMQHGSEQFMQETTANMNILVDVIDNFVDNLVARESSSNQTLSDTSDGHLSTDSGSNNVSSSPVTQQTQALDNEPQSPCPRQSSESHDHAHDAVTSLEPGMYFMPELQAFAPESFMAVAHLNWSPDTTPASSHSLPSGHHGSGSSLNVRNERRTEVTSASSSIGSSRTGNSSSSRTGNSSSSRTGNSSSVVGDRTGNSSSSRTGNSSSSRTGNSSSSRTGNSSSIVVDRTGNSSSSSRTGNSSSSRTGNSSSVVGDRTGNSSSSRTGNSSSIVVDRTGNSSSVGGDRTGSKSRVGGDRTDSKSRVGGDRTDSKSRVGGDRTDSKSRVGGDRTDSKSRVGGDRTDSKSRVGGDRTDSKSRVGGDRADSKSRVGGDRTGNIGSSSRAGSSNIGGDRTGNSRSSSIKHRSAVDIDSSASNHVVATPLQVASRSPFQTPDTDKTIVRPCQTTPDTDKTTVRPCQTTPDTDKTIVRPCQTTPDTDKTIVRPCQTTPDTDKTIVRPCQTTPDTDKTTVRPCQTTPDTDKTIVRPCQTTPDTDKTIVRPCQTTPDTDKTTVRPCQTTPDTDKTATVQFKKIKVAGKKFRVRHSKSRSSSDEDK